jgi:hypothetical protein
MSNTSKNIKTAFKLLWSKGAAIALLALLLMKYTGLSEAPFAELVYAMVLVLAVVVIAPVVRLLVFAEAAEMAESGAIRKAVLLGSVTPVLMHYWFATLVSYAVSLLCVSSLL